jgi:hypothetical protein
MLLVWATQLNSVKANVGGFSPSILEAASSWPDVIAASAYSDSEM